MENLKIKVNSEAESKEAQELFFELGYVWADTKCKTIMKYKDPCYYSSFDDGDLCCDLSDVNHKHKELTLPQLRDLVVLKRNDVGDATHKCETSAQRLGYLASGGIEYIWSYGNSIWFKPKKMNFKSFNIKPIEKTMKEYLGKNSNGTYSYIGTVRPEHVSDFMIEIPEGAQVYAVNNGYHYFFSSAGIGFEWSVLWQRPTLPEELPFIDDEPSINDQYAEIEKVRQSHRTASETADPTIKETLSQRQEQYGSFEDVAMITEQMVDVMRKGYYENLAYNQKMALYMICSKMARIVNGNPNHKDSWHDIAGYATLIDNELVSEKDMPF